MEKSAIVAKLRNILQNMKLTIKLLPGQGNEKMPRRQSNADLAKTQRLPCVSEQTQIMPQYLLPLRSRVRQSGGARLHSGKRAYVLLFVVGFCLAIGMGYGTVAYFADQMGINAMRSNQVLHPNAGMIELPQAVAKEARPAEKLQLAADKVGELRDQTVALTDKFAMLPVQVAVLQEQGLVVKGQVEEVVGDPALGEKIRDFTAAQLARGKRFVTAQWENLTR